ncbi:unnamed protein product [Victoria cruziana]
MFREFWRVHSSVIGLSRVNISCYRIRLLHLPRRSSARFQSKRTRRTGNFFNRLLRPPDHVREHDRPHEVVANIGSQNKSSGLTWKAQA